MALAFSATDGVRSGIALVSADGELVRDFDFAPLSERGVCCLSWAPDGRRLAYVVGSAIASAIYVINLEGSGRHRVREGKRPRHHLW